MSVYTSKHEGVIRSHAGNGTFCVGGWQYYEANLPTGGVDANGTPVYAIYDIPFSTVMYAVNDAGVGSELRMTPASLSLSAANATLENVTVWSANSILTRGYADTRYGNATHNHTTEQVAGLDHALGLMLTSINEVQTSADGKVPLTSTHCNGTFTSTANIPYKLHWSSKDGVKHLDLGVDSHDAMSLTFTSMEAGLPELGGWIALNEGGTSSDRGRVDVMLAKVDGGIMYQTGLAVYQDRIERIQLTGTPSWTADSLITKGYADTRYLTSVQPTLTAYRETYATAAIAAGSLTLDLATSNIFRTDLNANITTMTITGADATKACSFTLVLTASGTARVVQWPTSIKWPGGTAPALTTTAGKKDVFSFLSFDGGFSWLGFTGGLNL